MKVFLPMLGAFSLLAASACTPDDERCAQLPGGARYCLQPTSLLAPFEVQQKLEITYGGQRETLIVELEVDANGMRFAGLTPFGQKLVQASYDNRTVTASRLPDKRLPPALVLAMLQMAWWPAANVRAGLGDAAVLDEGGGQRTISADGKLLVEVGYTGGPPARDMHIAFPPAGIEIDITTLDSDFAR